ncbi:MAG: FtsX-like permease family protein [Ekhidna sp.]|uniref:ABC transporter permease n=1 Tax=Ekhidna sp. TaxID=2608089 RepID=UPI0032EE0B74
MLKNYLLVSLRNLKKHFTYSFVNIFGLTVGLACTLIIGIWVHQEYSYDMHFQDSDRIFRVGVNFFNIGNLAVGPEILHEKLSAYSDVEYVTSMGSKGDLTFLVENQEITIERGFKGDKNFFKVFSYPFLQGDPATALDEPNTVVLTEEAAMKLFGKTDVLGRVLEAKDDTRTYKITGVIDGSNRSHIPANMFFSMEAPNTGNWASASSYQYVKMKGENPAVRLAEILEEQQAEIQSMFAPDVQLDEFKASGSYIFLPMMITDIHLQSEQKFEPSSTGSKQTTDVFAGIALLILVLASINFINISTARATTRAKEVGIRKSLGTNRAELIMQFTMESVLVCLIAVTLAIGVGEIFLMIFEKITGLELLSTLFGNPEQFIIIYLGAVLLGVAAGSYPALYITRFKAVHVLKGNLETGEKGMLRNGLVLFQFSISICLLIVAIFIYNQLSYIENKDMGFDIDNVMVVEIMRDQTLNAQILKEELLRKSYVEAVSINQRMPANSNTLSISSVTNDEKKEVYIQQFSGDEDLMDCLGFRLLEGRNFDEDIASDTAAMIINESAVAELELENPVGKTVSDGAYRIIGVISDFNYESLKKEVGPAMLKLAKGSANNLSIKFSGEKSHELIADLNNIWASMGAKGEPSYYFLDENFARLVEREKVLSKAVLVFTILAMFISCLGLYGLSIFTAERRTKEIGIRRVLGASVSSITRLLSQNFAKPILIAFVIASPIAYYISKDWLSDYAYRIEVSWVPFALGGFIALMLGILTISWQSVKAALRNPVVSLRSE